MVLRDPSKPWGAVLKVQPTLGNDNIARTRADILMTHGSYAAVEALAHSAIAHSRRAAFDADKDLAAYWDAVAAILEDAKRKIVALPL